LFKELNLFAYCIRMAINSNTGNPFDGSVLDSRAHRAFTGRLQTTFCDSAYWRMNTGFSENITARMVDFIPLSRASLSSSRIGDCRLRDLFLTQTGGSQAPVGQLDSPNL
jgi:hypothetical protein